MSRLRSLTVIARLFIPIPGLVGRPLASRRNPGRDLLSHRDGPCSGQSGCRSRRTLDTTTNSAIWGDFYEGDLDNLHDVREKILAKVICTLDLQISHHEAERARLRNPEDLERLVVFPSRLAARLSVQPDGQRPGPQIFRGSDGAGPRFQPGSRRRVVRAIQNAFMQYTDDIDLEVTEARRSGVRQSSSTSRIPPQT